MAFTDKRCTADRLANLAITNDVTFIDSKVEFARCRVHRTACHAGRIETIIHTCNHGIERVLARRDKRIAHAAYRRVLVAFTAGTSGAFHTHFHSAHTVAHVRFQNTVFDKRRALRRRSFVIVLEATPHAIHRAIVNGSQARLANRFTKLSAERACIATDRFCLQRMAACFVENHAAKAIAHHDRHLAASDVTGIEHAQHSLATFRCQSFWRIVC